MYVYACALEAAAPTVFMGLATGHVLIVTFLLRYFPFSPHFECFHKFKRVFCSCSSLVLCLIISDGIPAI